MLEPRGNVANEGELVVLECLVNGWPRPDVRWLKGSESISADGDRVSSTIFLNGATSYNFMCVSNISRLTLEYFRSQEAYPPVYIKVSGIY